MRPFLLLTDEDKTLINKYCTSYAPAQPKNLDKTLAEWDNNKRKLLRLLGEKLRISFPIDVSIDSKIRRNKLAAVYRPIYVYSEMSLQQIKTDCRNHPFMNDVITYLKQVLSEKNTSFYCIRDLLYFLNHNNVLAGKTPEASNFWYKDKKILKITAGTKIMRAIRKILEYIDFPYMDSFKQWRDEISAANSDKTIKGNLVFSIHPIDYMTMSDNRCGWTSCMSWIDKGSYSIGTVEMMNSNVAIVAYLESNSSKFCFDNIEIPNKTWRTLVFAHKDILLVGKHYPFESAGLAKIILEKLQILAKQNLGWDYQYKNQLYLDMVNSYSNDFIRDKNRFLRMNCGHKIYTYMNKMYADIIEDHDTEYWCCRNYRKKSLYLNLSGKTTCIHCGKEIPDTNAPGWTKICPECEKESCSVCNVLDKEHPVYKLPVYSPYYHSNTSIKKICQQCAENDYLYMPENKSFITKTAANRLFLLKETRPITLEVLKSYEVSDIV